MGVTFFANDYPEYFAVFDRALITMFRITSGKIVQLCVLCGGCGCASQIFGSSPSSTFLQS